MSFDEVTLETDSAGQQGSPPYARDELEDDFLCEHWDCFNTTPSFAHYGPLPKADHVTLGDDSDEVSPIKAGEVYALLDFCCYRAPFWYRNEVNRLLQVAEAKNVLVTGEGRACKDQLLDIWESSHKRFQEQLEMATQATTTAATTSASSKAPPGPPLSSLAPTRVQPSRAAKRKATELVNSASHTRAKRSKLSGAPEFSLLPHVEGTRDIRSRSGLGYHISKAAFGHSLHLSNHGGEGLEGRICERYHREFRNRLIARATSKMTGIYSRKTAAGGGNKPRRCVLAGRETAPPWCGNVSSQLGVGGAETSGAVAERPFATPEPEMLPSPSFGNWPPPAKPPARLSRAEDVEHNVVEFEGLRFLVDVCGEPPVPRVMML